MGQGYESCKIIAAGLIYYKNNPLPTEEGLKTSRFCQSCVNAFEKELYLPPFFVNFGDCLG
jgi:hypothetical protein